MLLHNWPKKEHDDGTRESGELIMTVTITIIIETKNITNMIITIEMPGTQTALV